MQGAGQGLHPTCPECRSYCCSNVARPAGQETPATEKIVCDPQFLRKGGHATGQEAEAARESRCPPVSAVASAGRSVCEAGRAGRAV